MQIIPRVAMRCTIAAGSAAERRFPSSVTSVSGWRARSAPSGQAVSMELKGCECSCECPFHSMFEGPACPCGLSSRFLPSAQKSPFHELCDVHHSKMPAAAVCDRLRHQPSPFASSLYIPVQLRCSRLGFFASGLIRAPPVRSRQPSSPRGPRAGIRDQGSAA